MVSRRRFTGRPRERRTPRRRATAHAPYPRGAPPGLPFEWSAATVERGLDFPLTTAVGDVDLLGEITGGGDYRALLPHSVNVELFGRPCRCLDLPGLIRVKRAAGRPKDLEALAELEALLVERGGASKRSDSGSGEA